MLELFVVLVTLTNYNDGHITAHNINTSYGYYDQKHVEISVIPLGHTVSNLQERYKSHDAQVI